MYKALHPIDNTGKLQMSIKEGRRGIAEIVKMHQYKDLVTASKGEKKD